MLFSSAIDPGIDALLDQEFSVDDGDEYLLHGAHSVSNR